MANYIGRRKFLATLLGGSAVWPLAARAAAGGAGDRENIMSNGSSLSLPELEDRIAIIGADTSIQNDSGLPQGLAVCTGTRDSPGATALAQLNGGND